MDIASTPDTEAPSQTRPGGMTQDTPAFPRRVPTGGIVLTASVRTWIGHRQGRSRDIADLINRHADGDWGDVEPALAAVNDQSLTDGELVLSSFTIEDQKFWVITEADRTITTVLFPSDY